LASAAIIAASKLSQASLVAIRHDSKCFVTEIGFNLTWLSNIMFMTPDALEGFRMKDGWKVGVDGSVAIIAVGAGGAVDTNTIHSPIVGFIFDQRGLMYNLTLEGSKISRIDR
jgi:lipid-binding SYLF domain-containing protein